MLIYLFQLYVILKIVVYECIVSSLKFLAPIGWFPRKKITGQTILITGAANGIGRCLAERLALHHVNLVLWDLDEENLEKTELICVNRGSKVLSQRIDLTDQLEVETALLKVKREFKFIDILICNAGMCTFSKFVEIPIERMQKQLQLNLVSPMLLIRQVLPDMIEHNQGHIVTTASSRALIGKGMISDYSAEKHALLGLMEALEDEMSMLGKKNVKFTSVCPLLTKTKLTRPLSGRLPLLSAETVCEYYEDAILCEKRVAVVPKRAVLAYWLKSFMPAPVYQLLT